MRDQKIVIGFDGSPAAQLALDWALDEANRTGVPAELVYADEWPVWAPAASMVVVVRGDISDTAPVVAGVDDSPLAPAVLRFAAEQAAGRKVPLRVIRTWPPATRSGDSSTLAARTVTCTERASFDALVTGISDEFPDLEVRAEALREDPAEVLASFGDTTQLLVVGSRGRGAVRGLLLGSVSRHLLRHTNCPVAIVHDPGGTGGAS
jgi:nucleotide-binding universal stress UspA family protein